MGRGIRSIALAAALLGFTQDARAEVPLASSIQVLGRVTSATRPIENAVVIALNLANYTTIQTFSDHTGKFRLPPLRSGVYRIIALKRGFAPSAATVSPVKKDHEVTIRMASEKVPTRSDEIWAIRSELPSDVLREIESIYASMEQQEEVHSRFRAQMVSLTGMSADLGTPTMSQTALGVQGELASGWRVDFVGRMNRIDDSHGVMASNPDLESSGVVMQISASPDQALRIASSRSVWNHPEGSVHNGAGLETHNLEWKGSTSAVRLRYLAQENLFRSNYDSERLELEGETQILRSARNDVSVAVRLGQESWADEALLVPYRTADFSASGEFRATPRVALQYGLETRMTEDGMDWTPRTGAMVKLTDDTSIVISGMYKVADGDRSDAPATLLVWSETGSSAAPRYAYSFGLVSGDTASGSFKAIASITAADNGVRLVFDDGFDPMWQALWLDEGDVRQDVTLAYSKQLGRSVTIDVATTAGATRSEESTSNARYLIGSVQSLYIPWGTSLAITYRHVGQKVESDELSRRLNVQMGQALRLPLDLRLLVGIEVAEGNPYSVTADSSDELHRRYLGGLSFAF